MTRRQLAVTSSQYQMTTLDKVYCCMWNISVLSRHLLRSSCTVSAILDFSRVTHITSCVSHSLVCFYLRCLQLPVKVNWSGYFNDLCLFIFYLNLTLTQHFHAQFLFTCITLCHLCLMWFSVSCTESLFPVFNSNILSCHMYHTLFFVFIWNV